MWKLLSLIYFIGNVIPNVYTAPSAVAGWSCPSTQSGPFNIWINEIRYLATPAIARAVEIMSPVLANINSSTIEIRVVDSLGNIAGQKNLNNCRYHPNLPMSVTPVNIWVCDDDTSYGIDQVVMTGGGGIAIVQTLPGRNPRVLQYLAVGNASVYINTVPCYLPIPIQSLPNDDILTSLQLVGIAPMNATNGLTNIYGLGWQKGIDQTFGSLNNDPNNPSPIFTQDYRPSITPNDDSTFINALPFHPLTANPDDIMNHPIFDPVYVFRTSVPLTNTSTVTSSPVSVLPTLFTTTTNRTVTQIFSNLAIPGRPLPLRNTTLLTIQTNIPCMVGAYNDWSPCALSCSVNTSSSSSSSSISSIVTTGYQIRFQPVVTLPTGNGTLCPSITERSQTRSCTVTNPNEQLTCSNCNNLRKDGNESDIDCGGNIPDIFPYFPITFKNLIVNLFQNPTGTPPLIVPPSIGTTIYCPRCDYGRMCTAHNDCDRNIGLLCLPGFNVCAPWWLANSSYWIETNISMKGVDSRDMQGTAVSILRAAMAGGANPSNTNNPVVRTRDVALAGITYVPFGSSSTIVPPFRRLRTLYPITELADTLTINSVTTSPFHDRRRSLATSTNDQVFTRTIIGTDTLNQANEIVQNLNTNRQSTGFVIDESLRSLIPLINSVELSNSRIVSAASVGTPGSTLTTNIPNTVVPNAETSGTGLSGGAITGIVLGSIVGLIGLVVLGSIGTKVYQRYQEREAERQRIELEARNRRRQNGGINIGETTEDKDGNLSPLMKTNNFINELKDKEKFKPTHALHQTQPIHSEPVGTTVTNNHPVLTDAVTVGAVKEGNHETKGSTVTTVAPSSASSPPSVVVVTTTGSGENLNGTSVPSSPTLVAQPSPHTYASVQIVTNALKKAYSSLSSITNDSLTNSSSSNNNPNDQLPPSPLSLDSSNTNTDQQSVPGWGGIPTSPEESTVNTVPPTTTRSSPSDEPTVSGNGNGTSSISSVTVSNTGNNTVVEDTVSSVSGIVPSSTNNPTNGTPQSTED